MAKEPQGPRGLDAPPQEFAAVQPRDLHPVADIRLVIADVAKLTERIDNLISTVEKVAPAFERAIDKHTADVKERFVEVKADAKETRDKVHGLKETVDSFKGAMKLVSSLYALALVIVAGLLAWFLRPTPPIPASTSPPAIAAPSEGTVAQKRGAAEAAP